MVLPLRPSRAEWTDAVPSFLAQNTPWLDQGPQDDQAALWAYGGGQASDQGQPACRCCRLVKRDLSTSPW